MNSMRVIFGRWLPYFLGLLAVQFIVIIIVVIWTFGNSAGFMGSIYNSIANNNGLYHSLDFIVDWADVFSGLVVCTALCILLISLRRYHRERAVNRLHSWARNGVVALAHYRQKSTGIFDRYSRDEVMVLVDRMVNTSKKAIADAGYLRGEINLRTRQTVGILYNIQDKLNGGEDSLPNDLRTLQHDFAGVMILAFEQSR
jgi:hypothetical protein